MFEEIILLLGSMYNGLFCYKLLDKLLKILDYTILYYENVFIITYFNYSDVDRSQYSISSFVYAFN